MAFFLDFMDLRNRQIDEVARSKFDVSIEELVPREVIGFSQEGTISELVEAMSKDSLGAICIIENDLLIGIVTERDIFMKLGEDYHEFLKEPVKNIMTPKPITMTFENTIADCLRMMGLIRVRHIPIVDENGKPTNMLSAKDIMEYLIEFFPKQVKNFGTLYEWEVNEVFVQDENFSFEQSSGQLSGNVFLSPLKHAVFSDLLTIDYSSDLKDVIHSMRTNKKGMVAITKFETELVGVLTERDLLRKVYGKLDIDEHIPVHQVMTPNPVTLLEKHIVSYAINNMVDRKFRNIILVDEDRIPIASTSLIDLVKFVASKFDT